MNRITRFVDTGYWVALAIRSDGLHERALRLSREIRGPLVTTEVVLIELGNALSRTTMRPLAVRVLAEMRADPETEIVPLTTELFGRALAFYAARLDKEWGLADCVSFVVMQERGIREALSADQHFAQAGFHALLRE